MRIITLFILCSFAIATSAQQNDGRPVKEEITFVTDSKRLPDAAFQQELRHQPGWQHFLNAHGTWYAEFDEASHKPHRAYGAPIATVGATAEQRALNFIGTELQAFGAPMNELVLMSVAPTAKHTYVHFKQRHQDMDVLFSHLMVKLDQQDRVIAFSTDVHDAINMEYSPTLSTTDAENAATAGLSGVTSTDIAGELRILPVPTDRQLEYHLVYEATVHTMTDMPGRYFTLVDAHNGAVLYRQDRVVRHAPPAGTEVDVTGNVYEFQPYIPAVVMPMKHMEVVVNGSTFHTDDNGHVNSGITGPVSTTFRLKGDWSTVMTNGTTPSFTTTLNDGSNTVSFDGDANIRERSAYFHVNIIHDHEKDVLGGYTGMDFSLETNVDVAGTCNAFYDGSSINFYEEGMDCQSYAQIGEVVYHEYGHGVNDNFYQDNGGSFQNGAMNEGYADVWALSITLDPILAEGSSLSDPDTYIRRYDIDPKVYPVDITGEVHADGEIIAGAWWDTYVLLGNDMVLTMDLFAEAFPGLQATQPNGNEGVAYRDVLLDVLQADDDDGDITNGTPNGNAIVEAFGIHGITLISNAELQHTALESSTASDPITIEATLILSFPFTQYLESVVLNYRINASPTWTNVLMTNVGGNDYEAPIPAQPQATVVGYYLGVQDIFQQLSAVIPPGANQAEPNIPFFILVGCSLEGTEDCDNLNELGNWETGMPGDNATTGEWSLEIPVGSFTTDNIIVQTDEQHTPGGELCFLTGNAPVGEAIGFNDVDGGRTTLQGDPIDLSGYAHPILTFWRWYTNNPPGGANPGMDWWQVQISNNGNNWVYVENTRTSDKSWRRFAFRVEDYVTPNSNVQLRFIASDSTHIGEYLDGGSLIEAAVDDIQLWDEGTIGIEENGALQLSGVYPTPADDQLMVTLTLAGARDARLQVLDATGRMVIDQPVVANNGVVHESLDTRALSPGGYVLRLSSSSSHSERHFSVVH